MTASISTNAPTRFADVDGTRFAYRRFGTPGGPPVVCVQTWCDASSWWAPDRAVGR